MPSAMAAASFRSSCRARRLASASSALASVAPEGDAVRGAARTGEGTGRASVAADAVGCAATAGDASRGVAPAGDASRGAAAGTGAVSDTVWGGSFRKLTTTTKLTTASVSRPRPTRKSLAQIDMGRWMDCGWFRCVFALLMRYRLPCAFPGRRITSCVVCLPFLYYRPAGGGFKHSTLGDAWVSKTLGGCGSAEANLTGDEAGPTASPRAAPCCGQPAGGTRKEEGSGLIACPSACFIQS